MTHAITPDEVIARIDDWRGKDVRWQPLGGGITNHNYIVTVNGGPGQPGGGKFVLRIPGQGTDMFINRDVERACMIEAARVGVAPAVAYVVEPEKAMAITFIEGEIMHPETMAGHPERIRQAVETVKVVHEKAVFTNEIHVFEMIRDYTKIAQKVEAPWPDELRALFPAIDEIEQAMERDKPRPVACHNDLLSENFLIDGNGKMWLIDWEYGGMTDPYFDLGDFCMEHPFSSDEERLIIATYCGSFDEHRYYRMLLHKIVSAVWWAVWAMIQSRISQIDHDFMEWGMERVKRAQRGVADPDYRRWLATV